MDYKEHLMNKMPRAKAHGFSVEDSEINSMLFHYQRDIVKWGLYLGNAAIFSECGSGKTPMQLEWAYHVSKRTGKPVLILAPLAVAGQTVNESIKFNRLAKYVESQSEVGGDGIYITNYEKLAKFDPSVYGGVVLDESSILKNYTGKTKQFIMEAFNDTEFKLACTATPAPNDHLELGNHAEFLGVMKSNEMISRWFINDSMRAGGYRLKGHAENDFWRWVASWAVMLNKPSDVGDYDDTGFILPPLNIVEEMVAVDHRRAFNEIDKKTGQAALLLVTKSNISTMHKEKDATLDARMRLTADIALSHEGEPIVIWVNKNNEADTLRKLLPHAIEVRGNEKTEEKKRKLEEFTFNGGILITKPKIAAYGLNWQHCNIQIEASVDHSFEQFYQKIRRSWRFGQKRHVTIYRVFAESESHIVTNVQRKIEDHEIMQSAMVAAMKNNGMSLPTDKRPVSFVSGGDLAQGEDWEFWYGDAVDMTQKLDHNSVQLWVQSPPFKGLYIYSDAVQDLGNCATDDEFYFQYQFIINNQLNATRPGGYKAEHCKDLPLYKGRDGVMGLDDFPGQLIKAHIEAGWWFIGWKTIWKDPVIEMQRTKNAGLLWSSAFCERAERARQGMADYVLIFQKPDGNEQPLTEVDNKPVPEDVVNRCLDLWVNKYEDVFTPYHKHDCLDGYGLVFTDCVPDDDTIKEFYPKLVNGRLWICRVNDPVMMHVLIGRMQPFGMVFHSRVALTDGTWLVVFRKWVEDMPDDTHVTHSLIAPDRNGQGHKYIGTQPPEYWDSDSHYSIGVWQRYASPVWFDLDGLPLSHPDIWMDIQQTNVLNFKAAREIQDEKHICPLQLDVIRKCIVEYSKVGDLVGSAFGGIGSEPSEAIRLMRKAWACELKHSYWKQGARNIKEVEIQTKQPMFNFMY